LPANKCHDGARGSYVLLFVDESGHDDPQMPCEALAGVAVSEQNLWNLVRAVRAAEKEHFGDYFRNLRDEEPKAKKLLKKKRFRIAQQRVEIATDKVPALAHAALMRGKDTRQTGRSSGDITELELVAYSRAVLNFVDEVLNVAARHGATVFASVVDHDAKRTGPGLLRKDYVYLLERYFYYLETLPPTERGLVVFDELDKSQSHILIRQMAAYFLGTDTGRYRSSRIVPEPFFVHSELTTGIFLADLAAYILGWAWCLPGRGGPCRKELQPYVQKLRDMEFHGEKPHEDGVGVRRLHGIAAIYDLRGKFDRQDEEEEQ
jgi:hypothetical protein